MARLLEAQAKAEQLFAEIEERGLVAPGEGERAVGDRVRDLANELFALMGVDAPWCRGR